MTRAYIFKCHFSLLHISVNQQTTLLSPPLYIYDVDTVEEHSWLRLTTFQMIYGILYYIMYTYLEMKKKMHFVFNLMLTWKLIKVDKFECKNKSYRCMKAGWNCLYWSVHTVNVTDFNYIKTDEFL
jgi:hypothetical protein